MTIYRLRNPVAVLALSLTVMVLYGVTAPCRAQTTTSSLPISADQIIAVVNSDIITRNELRDRTATIERTLKQQGTQAPPRNVIEKQVLDRMIVERIQIQNALEEGMRVDDTQLDRAIARIAEQNTLSVQDFRNRVESEGTPFVKFRDEVRNEIMMSRLRDKEVDSKLQVTEGEIDNFLAEQAGAPTGTSEVNVAQILLRLPEQASVEQVERQGVRAEEIYQQIVKGADFAQLAASSSDAPEALKGGELGWRAPERLPQLFAETVAPLAQGETAKPIKSPAGFHILKLVGKRASGTEKSPLAAAQQTHARHILIKVSEAVTSSQARQKLVELKQRLDNKSAAFDELAKAYSNDASASRGGDLGTLYPGDTVAEFERAMNALKPNEVSEPVQTQFGWHLIEVLERKNEELSPERKRQIARQTLRERKSDEAYEEWLRLLRDRAYVENRLDAKS